MNKIIRDICKWWTSRQLNRRLARSMPAVVERRDTIATLRRRKKSTKTAVAMQQAEMTAALRMGVKQNG